MAITQEDVQQVLDAIKAESTGLEELETVDTLNGVNSLPGTKNDKLVSVPLTLLQKPATEAAALLGVSRPRITQLISAGGLEGYRQGRNTYVTKASIQARLDERPSLRTSHERLELLQA